MEEEYTYHYYDTKTLLVVNAKGVIRTLHTPFRVQCIQAIDTIPLHASLYVEEVHAGERGKIYFTVFGRTYQHHCFQLLI